MATKTFSSRADAQKLAFAETVTREKYGMSFGQYCGSVLVDAVCQGVELPDARLTADRDRKIAAIAKMKSLSAQPHDESIGLMSDDDIKQMLVSRYE